MKTCAEILEQSMGSRNRVGIWLSYIPADSLHRLVQSFPGIDSWAPYKIKIIPSLSWKCTVCE